MRQILVAPDSFKGTFPAPSVASAIGRGLERAGFPPPDLCPVADGGEGTLAALLTALGGSTDGAPANDPLGRPAQAGRMRSVVRVDCPAPDGPARRAGPAAGAESETSAGAGLPFGE